MRRALIYAALFIGILSPVNSKAECKDVLEGIFSYSLTSANAEFGNSFFNWYCSNEFLSRATEKNASGGISLGYAGVSLGLEFAEGKKDKGFYNKAVCSEAKQDVNFRKNFIEYVKIANPNVVNAWQECVKADREATSPGLYCSATTVEGGDIKLDVKYIAPKGKLNSTALEAPLSTAALNADHLEKIAGVVVSLEPETFYISRDGLSGGTVTLTVNTDTGEPFRCPVRVPEIVKQPFCWSPQCTQWNSDTWKCNKCEWKTNVTQVDADDSTEFGSCTCMEPGATVTTAATIGLDVDGHTPWTEEAECSFQFQAGGKSTGVAEVCQAKGEKHKTAGHGNAKFSPSSGTADDGGNVSAGGTVKTCRSESGKKPCNVEAFIVVERK